MPINDRRPFLLFPLEKRYVGQSISLALKTTLSNSVVGLVGSVESFQSCLLGPPRQPSPPENPSHSVWTEGNEEITVGLESVEEVWAFEIWGCPFSLTIIIDHLMGATHFSMASQKIRLSSFREHHLEIYAARQVAYPYL